ATRVECKEIDGPLTLLLTWAWIRLPFLAPIPGNPRLFSIANCVPIGATDIVVLLSLGEHWMICKKD
ncbi:hypothetical protein S245_020876, partial [Arachis hypogaea]